jgi:hypothetical protein
MKNLRRVALVAGIALSAVAFSPKAQAQTADVDFSGNVPATCTINSVTNGNLNLISFNGGTNNTLAAWTVQGIGTPGRINVSCNAGTTFTINSITNNGTDPAVFSNLTFLNAALYNPPSENQVANYLSNPTSLVQSGPIVNQDYTLDLHAQYATGQSFPVGNYGFRVNVSLAPQ